MFERDFACRIFFRILSPLFDLLLLHFPRKEGRGRDEMRHYLVDKIH